MKRITDKEILEASKKYDKYIDDKCAPVIEIYKKMIEDSFVDCKKSMLLSYKKYKNFGTPRECIVGPKRLATRVEIDCKDYLEQKIGGYVHALDRSGYYDTEDKIYMSMDITNLVMPFD